MLSIRIAQMLSSRKASGAANAAPAAAGIVVSVLSDSQSWEPHRELLDTMGLQNNLIAYQQLSVPFITALSASPELANVLILQGDVFVDVAHLAIQQAQQSDVFVDSDRCLARYVDQHALFNLFIFCACQPRLIRGAHGSDALSRKQCVLGGTVMPCLPLCSM
jgi:hypothetical protein